MEISVRPIRTEDDYDAALLEVDALMDALPDTPEGDRLDVLVTLVEAYEAKHWAID
jgi:HTH-type transcriptional regulator/antitoxin HigA